MVDAILHVFLDVEPFAPYVTEIKSGFNFASSSMVA